MRVVSILIASIFFIFPIIHAEEIKTKKGVILIQPLVESRARSASEKTMLGNVIKKNASIFYTNRLLLRIATEFFERIEVYGDIGSADIAIPDFDEFSSALTLAYGGGMNIKLLKSESRGHPYAIAKIRYIQYETANDVVNVYLNNVLTAVNEEITWREWEMGIGAGFHYGLLELNGGVRFSFINARDKIYTQDFSENMKLREEDNAGIFIDSDIYIDPNEQFAFNIGVTTVDVNSIYAGVKLWF